VLAIDHAITQIGVKEATGRNDGIPAERYNHGDELPWCAAFVVWCFKQAGTPIHTTRGEEWTFRSVDNMREALTARGYQFGRRLRPRRNDLIFFEMPSMRGDTKPSPTPKHVGIVERVQKQNGTVYVHTIEGNTGNAVKRRVYQMTDPRIVCYARPA
jgi:hypothetical protein